MAQHKIFILSILFISVIISLSVIFSLKDANIFIDGVHGNYGLYTLLLYDYQIYWSVDTQLLPSDVNELKKFDAIVIGCVPVNEHYGLSSKQVAALKSYVRDGGALLFIGGNFSYKAGNWGAFGDLLPVDINVDSGFQYTVIKDKSQQIELIGFHNLKPVEDATVLLSGINGEPLLIVKQYGKGRVGALAAFDILYKKGYQTIYFYPKVMSILITRNIPNQQLLALGIIMIFCAYILECIILVNKPAETKSPNETISTRDHLWALIILSVPCLILARGWFHDGLPAQHEAAYYYGAVASLKKALFSGNIWYGWLHDTWLGSSIISRAYPWYYAELPCLLAAIFVGEVWAFKIISILWLIIGGLGIYKVGGEMNLSYAGRLTASVIYQFWGLIQVEMFQMGFLEIYMAYFLAPFAFLFLIRLMNKPSMKNGILLGVLMGWILLCRMDVSAYFAIGFFIYGIINIWFGKQITKKILYLGVSIFIAELFLSIWILPNIIEQNALTRFSFKYEESFCWSSSSFLLAIMGRSRGGYNPVCHTMPAYNLLVTAISMLPFSLSALAVIREPNRQTLGLGAVILFSTVFAMGAFSPIPIFKMMRDSIPLMSNIRTPGRCLLVYSLAASLLSGKAISILESDVKRIRPFKQNHLSKSLPAILMVSLLLISIETTSTTVSGSQFRSISIPADAKKAFELMEEGSIVLEVPPSALPRIPGYHKNTYLHSIKYSELIHRYLISSSNLISVTGITADQHAPKDTVSYVMQLDNYIRMGDVNSFMNAVDLVPATKYLLVNNHWLPKETIEQLKQHPNLKVIYQSENVTLLVRTNCVEERIHVYSRHNSTQSTIVYLSQSFSDVWNLSCGGSPIKVNGFLMGWRINSEVNPYEIKIVPKLKPTAILLNLIPLLAVLLLFVARCPQHLPALNSLRIFFVHRILEKNQN